ncbi:hypothetical protein LVY65_00220 [Sphingomonas sp. G124]|uniref:Uncharacterized protein n=1 Tax=Sphingomonas cremea TaxID=2904799 RepID=A0A9X1QK55_9SPHN|nr:hypothetical protein [Sphingomonas cremea]MCF2513497.1 hypothetical protein [Sphingomonas cremea]
MRMYVAAVSISLLATPTSAAPKIDVQGLILGNEGARYLKGVPTLDLQQQQGAVQIRFLEWDHSNAVFAVGVYNAGLEPANVGLENLHASAGGEPVRIYTFDELKRQAKNRAMWGKIGLALLGGIGAAAAANQRDTYSGSISGPYGSYHYSGSYPSLAGQLQADRIMANTSASMALIQYRLDQTIEMAREHLLQTTTVDPGMAFAGLVVVQKLDYGKAPIEFRLDVDWNGERYPFGYLLLKKGQAVPDAYAQMLASKAKPRALSGGSSFATSSQSSSPSAVGSVQTINGAIALRSGAVKIPAKTPSGYCLRAPPDYVGTGSLNTPLINKALPRCSEELELGAP